MMHSWLVSLALLVAVFQLSCVKYTAWSTTISALCEDDSTCGRPAIRPNVGNRIVGGDVVRRNSWCWQISLQKLGSKGFFHTCGGSLIGNEWVVTAAHCVYEGGGPSNFLVLLGEHNRTEPNKSAHRRTVRVEQIIVHQKYIGIANYWRNDIALIKLAEYIEFNKYICPVCLPTDSHKDDLVNCWATGWGRQQTDGKSGVLLNQVDMKYYNFAMCSKSNWYGKLIWKKQICFGHAEGGKGTCQGDSGGPLVCYGREAVHWTLYGLTSWAKGGCASVNRPTIFTEVAQYMDWMADTIEENA